MLNILARIIQAKLENIYGGVRNISTDHILGNAYNDLAQINNDNSSLTNFSYLIRAGEDINLSGSSISNLHLVSNFIAILGHRADILEHGEIEVTEAAMLYSTY